MPKIKSYLFLALSIFMHLSCSKSQFHKIEEKPLGIVANADSIIISQYSVDNLTDSLTNHNLMQVQSFYFGEENKIREEKITGYIKGKVSYESISKIERDQSDHIFEKLTTLKDHFGERYIIETYLNRDKMSEIIETKYYIGKRLISSDTTRISYSENKVIKERYINSEWSKISEKKDENNKLKVENTYIKQSISSTTKETYEKDGRLRSSQKFIYNADNQLPAPQPPYTYTYILGKDGNPIQLVTVFGGDLLSISEIKIYHRTK